MARGAAQRPPRDRCSPATIVGSVPQQPGFHARVTSCRACPRLVAHRETVAREPPRRFRGQGYWARPVPSFGDEGFRLLIVGLAPAAHGANRTGRESGSTRRSTGSASRPRPTPRTRTTGSGCWTPGSPPRSTARRPATAPRARNSPTVNRFWRRRFGARPGSGWCSRWAPSPSGRSCEPGRRPGVKSRRPPLASATAR